MKDIPHREVSKCDPDRTGQTDASAPARGLSSNWFPIFSSTVQLISTVPSSWFGLIPGSIFSWLKKPRLAICRVCPDDIRPAELVTRDREQFSADNIFIGLVVPGDRHIFDRRLRTFRHPDLEVNGIIINGRFDRVDMEEQITVIHIEIRDTSAFLRYLIAKLLVQKIDVIHVAFMNAQHQVEDRIGDIWYSLSK